jgi:hypothetical protein
MRFLFLLGFLVLQPNGEMSFGPLAPYLDAQIVSGVFLASLCVLLPITRRSTAHSIPLRSQPPYVVLHSGHARFHRCAVFFGPNAALPAVCAADDIFLHIARVTASDRIDRHNAGILCSDRHPYRAEPVRVAPID